MDNYIAEVFFRRCTQEGRYLGFSPFSTVEVPANSLDEALVLISNEAERIFKSSVVFINQVHCDNRIVYESPWDELGPLPLSLRLR